MVRTERGDAGALLGAAGGGDDARAEHVGDLHRGAANARQAGVHQHGLAGLQLGAAREHVPGGLEDQAHGRRLGDRQRPGLRRDVGDRHADELGRGTVAALAEDVVAAAELVEAGLARLARAARYAGQDHDRIALGDAGGAGAERVDDAAAVAAQDQGQREGVARHAAPYPRVEMVEPDRLHAHADLAGTGRRHRPFLEEQLVEPAVLAHDDAPHRGHRRR